MVLNRFFGHDIDFDKAVTLLSVHHFVYVIFLVLSYALTLIYADRIKASSKERTIKVVLVGALFGLELFYHIHNWTYPRFSLPLHVCSFALFMNIALLLTDSKKVFNYAFFFGILGGSWALLIPLSYGYTYMNMRYYHFIIIHMLIVAVPLYYYKAYHYRVNYHMMLHVFRDILISMFILFLINNITNAHLFGDGLEPFNYWFVSYIPEHVQGFFPNWTIYIMTFIILIFGTMNLLYFVTHIKFGKIIKDVTSM